MEFILIDRTISLCCLLVPIRIVMSGLMPIFSHTCCARGCGARVRRGAVFSGCRDAAELPALDVRQRLVRLCGQR